MMGATTQTEPKTAAPPRPAARPVFLRWLFLSAGFLFLIYNAVLLLFVRLHPWWLFEFIRINYGFNTLAMPSYLAVCCLIGYYSAWRAPHRAHARRLKRLSLWALIAAAALGGARLWATGIEPSLFQVRHEPLGTGKLSNPVRILHITDIQSDFVGRREERAFEMMRALNPDLVIFTGDLLQPLPPATFQSELPKIDRLLRSLTPRLGFVAVGGDVDGQVIGEMKAGLGGMRLLEDESVRIDTGDGCINIYGMNRGFSRSVGLSRPDVQKWLAQAAPTDFTILVGHGPDYILSSDDLPIDLCLAGHTHGGQIRLPFYGPPITFSRIPRELARGFHKVGKTRLNVSAGIGGEHLAGIPIIRLNCPPEMSLFEIVPSK
ncbi:MAG: metallophosphoesterase [Candidatus Sumerlaeia bacterium]